MNQDLSKIVVGFNGKPSLMDIWSEAIIGLRGTAHIFEFGRIKYWPFSWRTDPVASDATIKNSLDAVHRHLTLHRAGFHRDPEGFPHLYHIACRTGMLVGNWYRAILTGSQVFHRQNNFPRIQIRLDKQKKFLHYEQQSAQDDFVNTEYLHTAAEHLISLSKTYCNPEFVEVELDDFLEVTKKKSTKKKDTDNEVPVTGNDEVSYYLDMLQLTLGILMDRFKDGDPYKLVNIPGFDKMSQEDICKFMMKEVTYLDIFFYYVIKLLVVVETVPEYQYMAMPVPEVMELLEKRRISLAKK